MLLMGHIGLCVMQLLGVVVALYGIYRVATCERVPTDPRLMKLTADKLIRFNGVTGVLFGIAGGCVAALSTMMMLGMIGGFPVTCCALPLMVPVVVSQLMYFAMTDKKPAATKAARDIA